MFPVAHLAALPEADPGTLTELFSTAVRIAAAIPDALGAAGTAVFQDSPPVQNPPHLHVHVIPRFPGDGFTIPGQTADPSSRRLRTDVARRIRRALDHPVP